MAQKDRVVAGVLGRALNKYTPFYMSWRITSSNNQELTLVSDQLKARAGAVTLSAIVGLEGAEIVMPERFLPAVEFAGWHRGNAFLA